MLFYKDRTYRTLCVNDCLQSRSFPWSITKKKKKKNTKETGWKLFIEKSDLFSGSSMAIKILSQEARFVTNCPFLFLPLFVKLRRGQGREGEEVDRAHCSRSSNLFLFLAPPSTNLSGVVNSMRGAARRGRFCRFTATH